MRVQDLIDFLSVFQGDDEIEIEIYEASTGQYIDASAAVAFANVEEAGRPILQIDVEAEKFGKFL